MMLVPIAMFAATTVLQYMKRSYKTRHAPALIVSQPAIMSSIAICANAPSASSSKSVEYGVALMASLRPVKSGWKVQNAPSTCSGESFSSRSRVTTGECCSQYQSQTSDKSIPSLHPVVCTSDGRGRPAQAKGESTGRGGKFARAVLRAARALDDHWIGDLIGAVCLFALGWMGLAIGWVLQ